jgi:hypothetical protein
VRRFFGTIGAATVLALGLAGAFASAAGADLVGPITFEPPAYHTGNINGQQGWQKLGPYDVAVDSVSSFPAASHYFFGSQALRLSNAVTSGSFGDQTFSPGLNDPAGEGAGADFAGGFLIGTAKSTQQAGLSMSVSPDDGNGSRMSYLRFEDQADGVHVFFDDVKDHGPLGTVADFRESDIATLDRSRSHLIAFLINFRSGPHNDQVTIVIDGRIRKIGTTWEDYYRYDPEQAGNGNQVPDVSKFLFREAGLAAPLNLNNGYLVDDVTLASAGHGGGGGGHHHHH